MYTTSIFSTSSGEPHRSPRRATETPHRLLAAPLVVYDFRPILHQNGRSRENPFGTFEVRYHGSPGGFRPLVLAPQHYKVMLHWDGRGRRSDPGRAHELVLGGHDPVLPRAAPRGASPAPTSCAPNCLERSLASWAIIKTGERD